MTKINNCLICIFYHRVQVLYSNLGYDVFVHCIFSTKQTLQRNWDKFQILHNIILKWYFKNKHLRLLVQNKEWPKENQLKHTHPSEDSIYSTIVARSRWLAIYRYRKFLSKNRAVIIWKKKSKANAWPTPSVRSSQTEILGSSR